VKRITTNCNKEFFSLFQYASTILTYMIVMAQFDQSDNNERKSSDSTSQKTV